MYPPTTPSLTICTEQTFKCVPTKNERSREKHPAIVPVFHGLTQCHPQSWTKEPQMLEDLILALFHLSPANGEQRGHRAKGTRPLTVHVLSPTSRPCSRHLRPWNFTARMAPSPLPGPMWTFPQSILLRVSMPLVCTSLGLKGGRETDVYEGIWTKLGCAGLSAYTTSAWWAAGGGDKRTPARGFHLCSFLCLASLAHYALRIKEVNLNGKIC